MISIDQRYGKRRLAALMSGLGIYIGLASSVVAGEGTSSPAPVQPPPDANISPRRVISGAGTLGYGCANLSPGFQGFGLGYHLGYGYGGDALGVGSHGGNPLYGGPGYPHPWPMLRRLQGIEPFCYFGGPGFPTPQQPHFFYGDIGPLTQDQPVITFENDPAVPIGESGYGRFDGTLPYPESTFVPYTARAGETGSYSGSGADRPSLSPLETPPNAEGGQPTSPSLPRPVSPSPNIPAPNAGASSLNAGRRLGIEEDSTANPDNTKGLKISKVYPQSAAEKAGLHAGDTILSINDHPTTKPSDLALILTDGSPSKALTIRARADGKREIRTLTTQLP